MCFVRNVRTSINFKTMLYRLTHLQVRAATKISNHPSDESIECGSILVFLCHYQSLSECNSRMYMAHGAMGRTVIIDLGYKFSVALLFSDGVSKVFAAF